MFFRALAIARVTKLNTPLPLAPIGFTFRTVRRFIESPLYPIPLRGWHKGALEPHILEEHLRLAFDVASLGEMRIMFEWATERRVGGKASSYVESLEKMDKPLLVISGGNDDLAPPASVRPGYERSRSTDRTYRQLPLGHIDLLVGSDAPLMTWPLLRDWLVKRSSA